MVGYRSQNREKPGLKFMYTTRPRPVTSHSPPTSHAPARSRDARVRRPPIPSVANTAVHATRPHCGTARAHCQSKYCT